MYLDSLRITFRLNNQLQTVKIDPENLKAFLVAHPDYEDIKIVHVRSWMLR